MLNENPYANTPPVVIEYTLDLFPHRTAPRDLYRSVNWVKEINAGLRALALSGGPVKGYEDEV